MKYGSWHILDDSGRKWKCRCECGHVAHVLKSDLVHGKSRMCAKCSYLRRRGVPRDNIKTHGMTNSPEYRVWVDMRRRCNDPNRPDYKNYGGRGVYVCKEWDESFTQFFEDMGERPSGKTLDRIDNDGPYSPENCTWSSVTAQCENKRTNVYYDFCGERLTISQAARKYNLSANTIRSRIKQRGWSPDDAVLVPVRNN